MKAKILLLSIITVLSGCAGSLPDKEEMVTLNDGRTYEEQKYNSHEDGYVWHSSDLKKDEYQNIIVHDVNVHVSKTIDRLLTDQTVENFKQELALLPKSNELNHNLTIRSGTFIY
ncbi:hypothetical protein [Vibrio mediterranei]|uniref:Uncharacterized protein n=1 Tax=Vibrio mediterranei TaxID=689 RepID=A0ABX5D7P4_9VIBR|nr:hypothetical protein [Vibrio mediterranei]PCD86275.1 hypothetical protein COR52_22700 [Vibrio mediterranei]PRQ65033.1 hypothetical protein COR51_24400 [Vibrio mediterranei]